MTNEEAAREKERVKRLWALDQAGSPAAPEEPPVDDGYGQPVSGVSPVFAMPTQEEREAFNDWLADAYEDAYPQFTEAMSAELSAELTKQLLAEQCETLARFYAIQAVLKHYKSICGIYARVRPMTDSDYLTVAVMVVDYLCSVGFQTPFSVGSIAFFIVRRGMMDQICPHARKQPG